VAHQKIGTVFVCLNFAEYFLTDFQNYFTAKIGRKFVTILSPKTPSHLKRALHYLVKCQVS